MTRHRHDRFLWDLDLEEVEKGTVDSRGNLHVESGVPTGGQFMSKAGRFSPPGSGLSHDGEGWRRADGTPASDEELARIKEHGVARGYTDVRLNHKLDAPMQVRAVSIRTGREKRFYSKEHMEAAALKKYARVRRMTQQMPKITAAIDEAALDPKHPDHEAALAAKVIQVTGFRVGGERNDSHGITTLEGEHVRVKGDEVELDFIGKGGVRNNQTFRDSAVARLIRRRVRRGGRIFDTNRRQVLDFVKRVAGSEFKVKDFRTWNGTAKALEVIRDLPRPKNSREFKKVRAAVAREVASFLGNTPAVALKAYIDPVVWGRIQPT